MQIYERSIARIEGLARLLVLEKLADTDTRYVFLESRRTLRGRPNPLSRYHRRRRKHNGDLKANTAIGGLEMNDYDVATLHIPYGPGWDARRIDKLVYQTVCVPSSPRLLFTLPNLCAGPWNELYVFHNLAVLSPHLTHAFSYIQS